MPVHGPVDRTWMATRRSRGKGRCGDSPCGWRYWPAMTRSQSGQPPANTTAGLTFSPRFGGELVPTKEEIHRRTWLGGMARAREQKREKIMDERGWRKSLALFLLGTVRGNREMNSAADDPDSPASVGGVAQGEFLVPAALLAQIEEHQPAFREVQVVREREAFIGCLFRSRYAILGSSYSEISWSSDISITLSIRSSRSARYSSTRENSTLCFLGGTLGRIRIIPG